MTPALAAILGGGVTATYVPILRRQIRDGEVGIPFGTLNPIRIRRDGHPLGFRLAAFAVSGVIVAILVVCTLILVQSAH